MNTQNSSAPKEKYPLQSPAQLLKLGDGAEVIAKSLNNTGLMRGRVAFQKTPNFTKVYIRQESAELPMGIIGEDQELVCPVWLPAAETPETPETAEVPA